MNKNTLDEMPQHIARFQISAELLRDLLHLPKDAVIGHVATHDPRTFWIYVEHPDLPETLPGEQWPECIPEFKQVRITLGEFSFGEFWDISLVDWGIHDKKV